MPDEVSNRSRRSGAPLDGLGPDASSRQRSRPGSRPSPVGRAGWRASLTRARRRRSPSSTVCAGADRDPRRRCPPAGRGARSASSSPRRRAAWPASTASPAATATDATRPGMMARSSSRPAGRDRPRGSRVARSRRAARAASSTSTSNRQPSTTTSTRRRRPSAVEGADRPDRRSASRARLRGSTTSGAIGSVSRASRSQPSPAQR